MFASCSFALIILGFVTFTGQLTTVHAQASPAAAQAAPAAAQAAPVSPHDIADTWQGTLHAGKDLRTIVKITKDDKGAYKGIFYTIDQSARGSIWTR